MGNSIRVPVENTLQTFSIRSQLKALLFVPVPTRGGGYTWRLQKKQTNACLDVFMMTAKYTDAFSFLITKSHSWSLVCTLNMTLDQ